MTNNPEGYVEATVVDIVGVDKIGFAVTLASKEDFPKFLNLSIGASEALHIAQILESAEQSRPLTNTLLNNITTALGAEFINSQIEDIVAGVFHAKVFYKFDGGILEFDARASDAIILAMINNQTILVSNFVLKVLGIDKKEYKLK